ncbi:alpha/beta hydrolase [Sphingosinicella sp. BN140058]|uniref:alpha/beta hydrolase n=1 Tax=Sphingosinicella sp. BN140058 TaxID=1892855 RepID=UPI00101306B7|nr:alpha/beta fold hydrolase [Sphingosinicella sp. BN140058]QAY78482.1 alpha/beta fold hydrolase [Sphingosinicella sp. BN140058]
MPFPLTIPLLLRLLLLLLLLGLAASWLLGSVMMRATPSAVPTPAAPANAVRLESTDGLRLAGSYWSGRRRGGPAILLLHGNGASRAALAGNAAWFAQRGYAALAIDLRGHGESAPAAKAFGLMESRDAAAGLAWLRRLGHDKVAVIGVSLGGAAALLGDDGPVAADALVLQAVYPDIRRAVRNRIAGILGSVPAVLLEPLLSLQARPRIGVWPGRLSPIAALPRFSGPVLIIGGGADRHTPPAETRALHAAARGPKGLWIAPGYGHDAISRIESADYRTHVLAFLNETIGQP